MDLTKIIKTNRTVDKIDAYYESSNKPRSRLGLSAIGHKCMRYLWYTHHGYQQEQPPGRVLRLFQLGNILEDQIVSDLMAAGYLVGNNQKEVEIELYGIKLLGHIDGMITRLQESKKTHLLEIKTAGEKSYKKLIKAGSYEEWNQVYKMQVQVYMLGLKLERCLAIVYNKNDSSLYTERIRFDRDWIFGKLPGIFQAIGQTGPPERNCPRSDWYEAKWCNFYDICWKKQEVNNGNSKIQCERSGN